MEIFTVLVENYKNTLKGLNVFVQVVFTLVLVFIFFAVISAFVNVILNGI